MPSAESYISGGEYTITLDGFVLAFEAGSMWDEWAVDEMTNSKTQRHYDDVKTIRRGGLTGVRAVYEKGVPPTFKAGDIVTVRCRGTELGKVRRARATSGSAAWIILSSISGPASDTTLTPRSRVCSR
jgi:hypothetical protein